MFKANLFSKFILSDFYTSAIIDGLDFRDTKYFKTIRIKESLGP